MSTYVNLTIPVKITDEDIDDIMSIALDGGVTAAWCASACPAGEYLGEYASDQISRGGTLIFTDIEEDEQYELTKDKLIKGITTFLCNAGDGRYLEPDELANMRINTLQIDAIDADAILQYALFGEIIYG